MQTLSVFLSNEGLTEVNKILILIIEKLNGLIPFILSSNF